MEMVEQEQLQVLQEAPVARSGGGGAGAGNPGANAGGIGGTGGGGDGAGNQVSLKMDVLEP